MKLYYLAIIVFLAACDDGSKFNSNSSSEKKKPAVSENEDPNAPNFSANTTGNEGGKNIDPTTIGDQGQLDRGGINGSAISTSEIASLCENASSVTGGSNTVFFPATKECSWSQNGNLGREGGNYQAREMQSKDSGIPADAVLCSLDIKSTTDKIQYDDGLLITLNNNVILSSIAEIPRLLDGGEVLEWDFDKIKGKNGDFDSGDYCLGSNSVCDLPGHDNAGRIEVGFDSKAMLNLASRIGSGTKKVLNVITLGDDDDGDCMHTGIELKLDYSYVKK